MKHRSTVLLFVTLVLSSSPAGAQVSDADRATARTLAQQGQDALEAKDWATAVERFGRADALVHAPTLMLGLARAEVGHGRWVAALEHYSRILREGVGTNAPPAWSKALQDAQKELAALEPRVPTVVIEVKGPASSPGAPLAARVTIDGVLVPTAALGVNRPVDPGLRTLRAEADGFAPVELKLTMAEGKVERVSLQLEIAQAKPVLDGQATPEAPSSAAGSPLRTAGFVGLGVGGAALIMGAVTGGLALSKHGDLASLCRNGHCTGQQSAIDSYNLMGGLSTGGFIAGGVLAGAGAVLVALAPRGRASGEARLVPLVGPGFAGARGRF